MSTEGAEGATGMAVGAEGVTERAGAVSEAALDAYGGGEGKLVGTSSVPLIVDAGWALHNSLNH